MEQINQCISCPHKSNWRECKRKCSFKYEMRRNDEVFQLKEKLRKVNEIAHWRMGEVDLHLKARLSKIQNIISGQEQGESIDSLKINIEIVVEGDGNDRI